MGFNLFIYQDIFESNSVLANQVRMGLTWVSFAMLVFVLIMVFVTPWCLLGLSIPVSLFAIRDIFLNKHQRIDLPKKERDKVLILTIYLSSLLLIFFCIPSFVANIHANPKDRFSSNYDAVPSYRIYGSSTPHDREHVIPQNWYSSPNHFVNDYVNVIWSNQIANNRRGNKQFCNLPKKAEYAIYSDTELVGYIREDCFMPTDEFKGDVARIVLYMYVTYKDDGLNRDRINLSLMKSWARIDPVSPEETQRNKTIQSTYGYSNFFVAFPGLIRYVV